MKQLILLLLIMASCLIIQAQPFYPVGGPVEAPPGTWSMTPLVGAACQDQSGAIWSGTTLDFSHPFVLLFQASFTNDDDDGADGIMAIFGQNIATNTNPVNTGGALGYYDGLNPSFNTHSFGVELDIFHNPAPAFHDILDDHASIVENALYPPMPGAGPVSINGPTGVKDGIFHHYAISWDPSTKLVKVFYECNLLISSDASAWPQQLTTSVSPLFSDPAHIHWGFTSSTGLHCSDQKVRDIHMIIPTVDSQIISGCGPTYNLTAPTIAGGVVSQWTTGSTSSSITVSTSGTYSVSIFDACGNLLTTRTFIVTIYPKPVFSISGPGGGCVCTGTPYNLTVNCTAGCSGDTYAWSDVWGGSTTSTAITYAHPAVSGTLCPTYSTSFVTVTNEWGCSDSASKTIRVYPPPSPDPFPTGVKKCAGDKLTLCNHAGCGTGTWAIVAYRYGTGLWTHSSTPGHGITLNPSLSNSGCATLICGIATSITTPETIVISYTATSLCSSCAPVTVYDTITINPIPLFNLSGPLCTCSGMSFLLTANVTSGCDGGCTYFWDFGPTLGGSTSNPALHPGITAKACPTESVSSMTITNKYGCSNYGGITVPVYEPPTAGPITGGKPVECAGSRVTLCDRPGCGTGSWSIVAYHTYAGPWIHSDIPGHGIVIGESLFPRGCATLVCGTATSITAPITIVVAYTVTSPCAACTPPAVAYDTITIYPTPDFTLVPPTYCVCSGTAYPINVTGITGCFGGCTYSWDWGGTAIPGIHPGVTVPGCPGITEHSTLTMSNEYCSTSHSTDVTINPKPKAGTISGLSKVCGTEHAHYKITGNNCPGRWSISGGTVIIPGIVTETVTGTTITEGGGDVVFGNVPCTTTLIIQYIVTTCCGSVHADYVVTLDPMPVATPTIISCKPSCPGSDIKVRICGSPGATVNYSYFWPGSSTACHVTGAVTLPAGPCAINTCTIVTVPPPPAACPVTEGVFTFNLVSAKLGPCVNSTLPGASVKVAAPAATITLVGPEPCQGSPYCIKVTGTPGATVYLSESGAFDPTFPAYVVLPSSTSSLPTSVTICGLVIPPPPPGGVTAAAVTFCISEIDAPGLCGCVVLPSDTYISPLLHPLPCLNVEGKTLPQVTLSASRPICPPSYSFTLDAYIFPAGGTCSDIWWYKPCSLTAFHHTVGGAIVMGDNFQPAPATPCMGNYVVKVLGTDGCTATATVNVTPSPTAAATLSVVGTYCEGVPTTALVTVTGVYSSQVFYTIMPSGVTGFFPTLPLSGTGTYSTVPFTPTPGCYIIISFINGIYACPNKGPFTPVPITVDAAPTASITETGTLCEGQTGSATIDITGTSGSTVAYSIDGVAQTPVTVPYSFTTSLTTATVYTITDVLGSNGCHNIAPISAATVTATPQPTVSCTFTGGIDPESIPSYIVTGTPAGAILYYRYYDNGGGLCTGLSTIPQHITLASGGVTYIADDDPTPPSGLGCIAPTATYGLYLDSVNIINPDGSICSWPLDCGSTFRPGHGVTDSIPATEITSLSVIPDPNKGIFTIKGTLENNITAKEVKIEVVDMLGKVVYKDAAPIDNGHINKNITLEKNIANGIYLIRITHDNASKMIRFSLNR